MIAWKLSNVVGRDVIQTNSANVLFANVESCNFPFDLEQLLCLLGAIEQRFQQLVAIPFEVVEKRSRFVLGKLDESCNLQITK